MEEEDAEGLETPSPWPGMEVGDPRTLHHGHALQKQIAAHPLFPGTASGARLTWPAQFSLLPAV